MSRTKPPSRHKRLAAKLMVLLAACGVAYACASLLHRATTGQTDFSVFYRTAQAIRGGAPAEFYAQRDEPTGFHRCIAPSGTALFCYMPWLSIRGAALVWIGLNLGLLVVSAWCLRRVFGALERQRRLYRGTWLWACAVLMILSVDCLQVGQLSLLFTTCWLAYLVAGERLPGAVLLMLPTAIKLYPGLLLAVPVGLRRWRQVLWLPVAAILVGWLLPWLPYGGRLPGMWAGFFRYTILGGESSRALAMVDPYLPSNQSLDVTVLRYLADLPGFGQAHPHFPHLTLDPALVMRLILALKLVILVLTGVAAWRLGKRAAARPHWTALVMLALWSVTLYLLLPETKARYAVYTFPAWLPLLAMTGARRRRRGPYLGRCVLIALGLAALLELLPDELRLYGTACVVTVVMWGMLLSASWRGNLGTPRVSTR